MAMVNGRTTVHNINYIIDQLVTNTRHEVIDISGKPEQAHTSVDVWNFCLLVSHTGNSSF